MPPTKTSPKPKTTPKPGTSAKPKPASAKKTTKTTTAKESTTKAQPRTRKKASAQENPPEKLETGYQRPKFFKVSSVADTGIQVKPKSFVMNGYNLTLVLTVNGEDQKITVPEHKIPAQFLVHWGNLQASLINKIDAPSFVHEKASILKRVGLSYGTKKSIDAQFLVPREKFAEHLELSVKKLAWYTEEQLQDIDKENLSPSMLSLHEVNLIENMSADSKKILQNYLTMINVLEEVTTHDLESVVDNVRSDRGKLKLVSPPPK